MLVLVHFVFNQVGLKCYEWNLQWTLKIETLEKGSRCILSRKFDAFSRQGMYHFHRSTTCIDPSSFLSTGHFLGSHPGL